MTRKIQMVYTCDQCPEPNGEVIETLRFSYGAIEYETDLCAAHKAELDTSMSALISPARRISNRTARDRKSDAVQLRQAARAWGIANGRPVSQRGRVAASVITDYQESLRA